MLTVLLYGWLLRITSQSKHELMDLVDFQKNISTTWYNLMIMRFLNFSRWKGRYTILGRMFINACMKNIKYRTSWWYPTITVPILQLMFEPTFIPLVSRMLLVWYVLSACVVAVSVPYYHR